MLVRMQTAESSVEMQRCYRVTKAVAGESWLVAIGFQLPCTASVVCSVEQPSKYLSHDSVSYFVSAHSQSAAGKAILHLQIKRVQFRFAIRTDQ
jgi:hypothetical protein